MCETACSKLLMSLVDGIGDPAAIDPRGYRLIHQALTESASLGTDCEIEQMVRARNVPAVRQRVQVQFEYDPNHRISALRILFEQDGEVVRFWLIRNRSEILELLLNTEGADIDELTDLFTVIYVNMQTVKKYTELGRNIESLDMIEKTIPELQTFWLKSKDYSKRQRTVKISIANTTDIHCST